MKIIYIGPISLPHQAAIGGFESANRKNIDTLRKKGVEVVECPNPIINHRWGMLGKIAYVKLLVTPFHLMKFKNCKDLAIHITPLYNKLLWPSFLTVWAAHKMGIPILVDIRAGSLIHLFDIKSKLWRKGMVYLLNLANAITAEGKSYEIDIPHKFGINKKVDYFPNITYCKDLPPKEAPKEAINLCYFGRISTVKGIDILTQMMKSLDCRFRLYMAGNIADDFNKETLKATNIFYLGMLPPTTLNEVMKKMHIFVFPTRWMSEGQSNSLIEAMQQGLVPIVSDQGFNRDVVGDCGIILPKDSTSEDYIRAIQGLSVEDIIYKGKKAHDHIVNHHNIEHWIPQLINIYQTIIK